MLNENKTNKQQGFASEWCAHSLMVLTTPHLLLAPVPLSVWSVKVTPLPFALAFRLSFCAGPLSLTFLFGAVGVKSRSNRLVRNPSTNETRVANMEKGKSGSNIFVEGIGVNLSTGDWMDCCTAHRLAHRGREGHGQTRGMIQFFHCVFVFCLSNGPFSVRSVLSLFAQMIELYVPLRMMRERRESAVGRVCVCARVMIQP